MAASHAAKSRCRDEDVASNDVASNYAAHSVLNRRRASGEVRLAGEITPIPHLDMSSCER